MNESQPPQLSPLRLICTIAIVGLVAAAAYWYGVNSVKPPSSTEGLKIYGMDQPIQNKLHSQYTDSDGDLVADPPQDENQWLDPPTLNFCYLASDQERYEKVWVGFLDYLGQQTGKEVSYLAINSADEQLRAIKSGQLHVTGINTGATPVAVNAGGFVPVCGFGKGDSAVTYTMKLVVPKGSSIFKVDDLAGKTLTLTNPTSNSGWKAPLTILKREFKLLPVRDFAVIYSNGHAESLRGIASGTYEIAAVASDEVDLAIERGVVMEDQFVVIHESKPFINNVFGHIHNLNPDLAKKIRESFLSFAWADSDIAAEFSAFGADQFVPVSYQEDLKLIREIDDAMGRRHAISDGAKKDAS